MNIDIRKRIEEALDAGYLMSLGTTDSGGVWVSDVVYVRDGLDLYWMSSPHVRHSKALESPTGAAASITVNLPKEDNFGVQIQGTASRVEGLRADLVAKIFMKRKRILSIDVSEAMKGKSWYVLRPTKIDLIDEKHLGFKKLSLELPA